MDKFLDRLMAAESGGHLHKKNPRSTALGPFQFIESTFLFVVNRHFPSEVVGLTEQQVLALRTDMAFSRRAAGAYANDLISALKDNRLRATTVNVRLAFLVGPVAAVRLLKAPPDQPLKRVLSADAIAANPYMSGATVAKLVRRAAGDVTATDATKRLGALKGGEPAAAEADLEREPASGPAALGPAALGPAALEPAALEPAALEPAALEPAALEDEPPATPVALQGEPTGTPGAWNAEPAATTPADAPSEIKCEIGLASCRKWITLQERKAQLLSRSAQRQ